MTEPEQTETTQTDTWSSLWRRLTLGGPKPVWLRYLLLIAAASGLTRFALGTEWMRESAVLYVLIPYLVGVLIYIATPQINAVGYWSWLWRQMRVALIVMLSTSLLLFEGFLCVLMFLPIYLFFAMLAALSAPSPRDRDARDKDEWWNKLHVSLIPLLIIFLSLDGIRGTSLSFGPDRDVTVSRSIMLDLSPEEIRANIIDHAYPDEGRSRFLALFPRPVSVEARSLDVGAQHVAEMEYRRWGVPGVNVHRGTTVMEFIQSSDTHLHAAFVHDDSYLSHYMTFKTWTLDLEPQSDGSTRATLAIAYKRDLAPSWYFGPLQKRAVGDGIDYALRHIMGDA